MRGCLFALLFTSLLCPLLKAAPRDREAKLAAKALGSAAPEQQVAIEEVRYNEACLAADTKYFETVLADAYLGTSPEGLVSGRTQLLADWKSGALKFETIDTHEMTVRSYGRVAVVSARSQIRAKFHDHDISGAYQYTRVWLKQNHRWQVIAFQDTAVVAPPK